MTGNEMQIIRKNAGLTQSAIAERLGISRKTIIDAEGLGDGTIDRRTELAVRAITMTGEVRAELIADSKSLWEAGNAPEAKLLERAAAVLTGNYATDKRALYNLARTVAILQGEVNREDGLGA